MLIRICHSFKKFHFFSSEDMQLLLLNYREDLITAKIAKVQISFFNSRSFL
jgi:hypothetical protein